MKRSILMACLLVPAAVCAGKQPFNRYQSVVDRQMFGPLPPGFDPTARPSDVRSSSASERELSQEQEKLKSAIRFSAIDVRPSGEVAVGFADNSDPKSPRFYFLKVGESRDGWTVREADAEAATMTIVKDDVEVTLVLGGDSSKGGGTTARAGAAPSAERRPELLSGMSLRARRKQRLQAAAAEQAKAEAVAAEREAERQAQAEQEKQQREAERAEQRQQLLAIQEELRRVREARAAEAEKPAEHAEAEE
ncbi:MAG: hypothetical protein ACI4RD_05185 [Kiritimatiellia bacterium]